MASGSTVDFPVSESPQKPGKAIKAPHLPFRRISLPTAPSRVSVVSIASFDSFRENGGDTSVENARSPGAGRKTVRPISVIESPRRRTMTRPRRESSVKPVDDRLALKRRKIVDEFYETEKAYVDGLELIYSHFLTPIIASLDTPEPLLNRSVLTSIFSNFVDIWNLHRSFLSVLTSLLEPSQHETMPISSSPSSSRLPTTIAPPNLSPLLLAHFPYLSLYTPFVTAFPSTISALSELITPPSAIRPSPQYNSRFATFLSAQEADPRCGKFKLRDWLLTIVQRCPRYLLLLKDLISSTSKEDSEHTQLLAVHALVSKITLSLNTSLFARAQTLSLLALQKSTPSLPFQLISPGRTLLKRGSMLQVERSGDPVEREFLLFSDCMIWLAGAESMVLGSSWDWSWSGSGSGSSVVSGASTSGISATSATSTSDGGSHSSHNTPVVHTQTDHLVRPAPMKRSRSKSESEAEVFFTLSSAPSQIQKTPPPFQPASPVALPFRLPASTPTTPQRPVNRMPIAPPNMVKRPASTDDKWVYKGRVDLVDVQVVVGHALGDERRFEVLSPEGSFVLYASSEHERDEWTSEIRGAKAQVLASLNVTNPNSTLTSSASTNHVRRALQALPYPPSDDRLATVRAVRSSSSMDVFSSASTSSNVRDKKGKGSKKDNDKEKEKEKEKEKKAKPKRGVSAERRHKVEHWVPAIWIPDGKTSSCMRCGRMFGWRRRRHHCRLCGRCVCAGCSGRTFFITDANANSKSDAESKPARACDACYETVFPLIDPPDASDHERGYDVEHDYLEHDLNHDAHLNTSLNELRGSASDTITSLSHLPSWLSMPALPVQRQPQALMAIDLNLGSGSASKGESSLDAEVNAGDFGGGGEDKDRNARMRVKSHQRLRSYQQIVEDFQEQARVMKGKQRRVGDADDEEVVVDEDDYPDQLDSAEWFTPTHSVASSPVSSPQKKKQQRREDTARRSKRFSLPVIALHTTNVTARTTEVGADRDRDSGSSHLDGNGNTAALSRQSSSGDRPVSTGGGGVGMGMGKSRRFSLVLAGRNSHYPDGTGKNGNGTFSDDESGVINGDLARGVAAAKLSELLGRKTSAYGKN